MPVPVGSVRVVRDGYADVLLPFARVRAEGAQYDRTQHRAPYGSTWFTSGSRHRRLQEWEVQLRVESAGVLPDAATVTRDVVALIRDAVRIETPIGHIINPVVLMHAAAPAEGGAFTVTLRVSASQAEVAPPAVPATAVLADADPVMAGEDFVVYE